MSSSEKPVYSDELLTRFLLGALPSEQAEKLDELSVADDEFAWRLNAVENDLVDGFVRGELPEESRKRFESFYLSSPKRRQKVDFATGLFELQKRSAVRLSHTASAARTPAWRRGARLFRQWSFAAALALLLLAGYLFVDNVRLHRQMDEASKRGQEQELARQHGAGAQNQSGDHARDTSSVPAQLNTVALLLPSPTRGIGRVEVVSVHPGTDLVVLVLIVEPNDFSHYRVSLTDTATRQEVWRSSELASSSTAGRATVVASVPAKLLQQQRYLAQLMGVQPDGAAVPMGDYPFSVVLK